MIAAKTWTVEVHISEHDDERLTRAEASLRARDGTALHGIGVARRNPEDQEVPEIGDELAAARALDDLSSKLRQVASTDIEQVTHEPADLVR